MSLHAGQRSAAVKLESQLPELGLHRVQLASPSGYLVGLHNQNTLDNSAQPCTLAADELG